MFEFILWLQGNRKDREIENLFTTVQTTIDAKETSVERCRILSQDNLPLLKYKLEDTLTLCENVLNRKADPELVSLMFDIFVLGVIDGDAVFPSHIAGHSIGEKPCRTQQNLDRFR